MELMEIIEVLEEKIEHSMTIPFWGRGIVDKDELLDILQEARIKFPDEMKQAKWVKEERQRIINDAQKEAAAIIKNAEDKILAMVNEHEITKQAYAQANEIIERANDNAREVRTGCLQYADGLMQQLEENLITAVETVRENRKDLKK